MELQDIQTVKIKGNGYLINGSISVPKVDGNRHYEVIKEWLLTNTADDEFTQAELDQQAKDIRISEIDARLFEIDIASVRALRSKSNGRGQPADDTQLTALDDEAIALRAERATLVV